MKVPVTTCILCGARIIWTIRENGHPMPVDAKPRSHGNLRLERRPSTIGGGTTITAVAESPDQNALWGEATRRYTNHESTCPRKQSNPSIPKEKPR